LRGVPVRVLHGSLAGWLVYFGARGISVVLRSLSCWRSVLSWFAGSGLRFVRWIHYRLYISWLCGFWFLCLLRTPHHTRCYGPPARGRDAILRRGSDGSRFAFGFVCSATFDIFFTAAANGSRFAASLHAGAMHHLPASGSTTHPLPLWVPGRSHACSATHLTWIHTHCTAHALHVCLRSHCAFSAFSFWTYGRTTLVRFVHVRGSAARTDDADGFETTSAFPYRTRLQCASAFVWFFGVWFFIVAAFPFWFLHCVIPTTPSSTPLCPTSALPTYCKSDKTADGARFDATAVRRVVGSFSLSTAFCRAASAHSFAW